MEKTPSGIVKGNTPLRIKNVVLVKELNDVLYALAVRTSTDMVYERRYKYTLTELLDDIQGAILDSSRRFTHLKERFDYLLKDCPNEANTLKKIWDYINVDNRDPDGNPKSALIQLIESRVEKEDGKGLSTNDLTDLLYEKLVNDYTVEELDQKFQIIEMDSTATKDRVRELERTANVLINDSPTVPPNLSDGAIWFQIISIDGSDSGS